MLEWLLAPIDAARGHEVGAFVSWHGRLMVLAWSFLLPTGILVARFMKIWPRQDWPARLDHQGWWYTHQATQYTGAAATLLAVWLIWQVTSGTSDLHRILGWTTVALLAVQVLGGWLRGSKGGPTGRAAGGSTAGDHYDMTPRRLVFEYVHKTVGYTALAAAAAATLTGLWAANAAHWMWIVVPAWWLVLAVAFAILQRYGVVLDTYQAIWGPDPAHPGNRRRPVGWGITRYPPANEHPDKTRPEARPAKQV